MESRGRAKPLHDRSSGSCAGNSKVRFSRELTQVSVVVRWARTRHQPAFRRAPLQHGPLGGLHMDTCVEGARTFSVRHIGTCPSGPLAGRAGESLSPARPARGPDGRHIPASGAAYAGGRWQRSLLGSLHQAQMGLEQHDRERHAVRQHAPAHSVRSMTIASPDSRASWPQRPPFARTRPAMLAGSWCCVAQLSQLQTVDRPRPAKNCTRVLLDVLPMTYHHHFSPRHLRI